MSSVFLYAALVPYVAALLAYLAGLVVAIILLIRVKGTASILAVVSFALLALISVGQIVLALPPVSRQFFRVGPWSVWFLNCCCGIFDVAAIVCLVVAIWQAVSSTGTGETAKETAYATETLEEPAEESPYATKVLDETESPEKSPYATQVLDETEAEEIVEASWEAVEGVEEEEEEENE